MLKADELANALQVDIIELHAAQLLELFLAKLPDKLCQIVGDEAVVVQQLIVSSAMTTEYFSLRSLIQITPYSTGSI